MRVSRVRVSRVRASRVRFSRVRVSRGVVLFPQHYVLDHKESTHQTDIIINKTSAAGQLCA